MSHISLHTRSCIFRAQKAEGRGPYQISELAISQILLYPSSNMAQGEVTSSVVSSLSSSPSLPSSRSPRHDPMISWSFGGVTRPTKHMAAAILPRAKANGTRGKTSNEVLLCSLPILAPDGLHIGVAFQYKAADAFYFLWKGKRKDPSLALPCFRRRGE